jgi:hypothetical protein
MTLASYWKLYDATLERIVRERPTTFEQLKVILDSFEPPSSAQAFFPDGADNTLWDAITAAGWQVIWADAYYHYRARCSSSGAEFEYVEGDLYDRTTSKPRPLPRNEARA